MYSCCIAIYNLRGIEAPATFQHFGNSVPNRMPNWPHSSILYQDNDSASCVRVFSGDYTVLRVLGKYQRRDYKGLWAAL